MINHHKKSIESIKIEYECINKVLVSVKIISVSLALDPVQRLHLFIQSLKVFIINIINVRKRVEQFLRKLKVLLNTVQQYLGWINLPLVLRLVLLDSLHYSSKDIIRRVVVVIVVIIVVIVVRNLDAGDDSAQAGSTVVSSCQSMVSPSNVVLTRILNCKIIRISNILPGIFCLQFVVEKLEILEIVESPPQSPLPPSSGYR